MLQLWGFLIFKMLKKNRCDRWNSTAEQIVGQLRFLMSRWKWGLPQILYINITEFTMIATNHAPKNHIRNLGESMKPAISFSPTTLGFFPAIFVMSARYVHAVGWTRFRKLSGLITLLRVIPAMTFYLIFFLALRRAYLLPLFLAFFLAVQVRLCPLRSGTPTRGPALPTPLARSRLRSGAAHSARDLPVEARRCPLRSRDPSWGPALPTAMKSWQGDEEEAEEEKAGKSSYKI